MSISGFRPKLLTAGTTMGAISPILLSTIAETTPLFISKMCYIEHWRALPAIDDQKYFYIG